MRPENWFKRLLRKLGLIKEHKIDEQKSNELKRELKREMCGRSIYSGVCPEDCEICAWNVK